MDNRLLAGVGVVVVAVALVFAAGFGPALAGGNGEDVGEFPAASDGSDGGSSRDGSTAGTGSPYTLTVDEVEPCGQTCRDVTSTLENERATDAEGVAVYSRTYAGNGTDGEVVWEGKEPVGGLHAGEAFTTTRRVELSFSEAYTVSQHDGWVTIETAVQSEERTVTFNPAAGRGVGPGTGVGGLTRPAS